MSVSKRDPHNDDPESEQRHGPIAPKLPADPEESLTAEVSADVAPVLDEFMAKSAYANEAEAEAVADHASFAATAGLSGASFASEPVSAYISFENVYKSFGDFVVLEDVSFFVNPGETLCILGRSGVGKSVSLGIIMGFLKPDSGTVMVAGHDVTGFSEREMQDVRHKVTMVFQNGALFDSVSVGENVAFPLRERGNLAEDQILLVVRGLLEMVGGGGDGGPAAERSFYGHEAVGCHRAGPGGAAGGDPVRRADHDGGPADGTPSGRPHPAAEDAATPDQHRGDARYALRGEAGGSRGVSARGPCAVLWNHGRDAEEQGSGAVRISASWMSWCYRVVRAAAEFSGWRPLRTGHRGCCTIWGAEICQDDASVLQGG